MMLGTLPQLDRMLRRPVIAAVSARRVELALSLVMAGSVIALCAGVLIFWRVSSIWDDAYMFLRYTDNLLHSGKLSWNASGEPTFGLTAPAYLLVVVPMRLLFAQSDTVPLIVSSMLGGVVFVVLLLVLLAREIRAPITLKLALMALVLFELLLNVNTLAVHFTSGMDTTFALAYGTLYILVANQYWHNPSRLTAAALSVCGALAFVVRPDLLIYAVIVPLALLVFARTSRDRRAAVSILCFTLVLVLAQIAFANWYFQSPLPLPFYAKALQLYGAYFRSVYDGVAGLELLEFAKNYWVLIVLIGIGFLADAKNRWCHFTSVDKGLFAATVLYLLFFWLSVVPVMTRGIRFYYPTLPALAWLACRSVVVAARQITLPQRIRPMLGERTWLLGCALWIVVLLPIARSQFGALRFYIAQGRVGNLSLMSYYRETAVFTWFQLDRLASLPDDLVLAMTEVGIPSAMNPHKSIVDMAGLNTTELAHDTFSADRFFARYQPDWIYMPHPDYKDMITDIMRNPYFIAHYQFFELQPHFEQRIYLNIAIRRDSPYYAQMLQIVTDGLSGRAEN